MIYDRTCTGRPFLPGLTHAWASGGWMYRGLGRFDAHFGAASWREAFEWLAQFDPGRPIAQIQYWGHGKWGHARLDREELGVDALAPDHALHEPLSRVRDRLVPGGEALWWFRTCELFGARPGHEFALAWTRFLGARVAGHTFIIGHWQSGLHSLAPGRDPTWPLDEGLESGTPDAPEQALWSSARAPNTVSFLSGKIPRGY